MDQTSVVTTKLYTHSSKTQWPGMMSFKTALHKPPPLGRKYLYNGRQNGYDGWVMPLSPWEDFFRAKITKIFTDSQNVLDIGGGLRIAKDKNNRYSAKNEWIIPLLAKVDYKVLDPVADYNPDIVGDIHNLPMADNSLDAITCIAVLEHVKNPFKAVEEMHRVLKPGGQCFVYVPFLYYYHPMKGYYDDYWRFTNDGLDELFKEFSVVEKQNVRGAIETVIRLTPIGRMEINCRLARYMDGLFNKINSRQTSGYHLLAVK